MKVVEITAVFQCLADSTRLRILRLLLTLENTESDSICVSDFVTSLGELQYNVSKQLKILQQAGLVKSKKTGRNVYFSLTNSSLAKGVLAVVKNLVDSEKVFAADKKALAQALSKTKKLSKTKVKKQSKPAKVSQPKFEAKSSDDLPSNLL